MTDDRVQVMTDRYDGTTESQALPGLKIGVLTVALVMLRQTD
jgi:hypothetical protein